MIVIDTHRGGLHLTRQARKPAPRVRRHGSEVAGQGSGARSLIRDGLVDACSASVLKATIVTTLDHPTVVTSTPFTAAA